MSFRILFSAVLLATMSIGATANDRAWQRTFERISASILVIQVDQTRAFDGLYNQSTQATGFVVDAERGIVLTNRHVVNAGPVIARGTFGNGEEVTLTPIYRDPVHDFGFFRYNPAALRFTEVEALPLAPHAAKPGISIWVVGNDDGEQLSVLSGTLARKDREAPNYGWGRYNDFNTFYYQSASSISGGSSGSPVIDRRGRVVALAAGANRASAASFFLPLERAVRALRKLQAGDPVHRGTLQTTFKHQSYAELARAGLSPETEAAWRDRDATLKGLLSVASVIPDSPAATSLYPGDVLISINGRVMETFLDLSSILDDLVGQSVTVEVERTGTRLKFQVPVTDLHAVTPDEYIDFDGAVVHQLSYQQARHHHRNLQALYVSNPGFSLKNGDLDIGDVLVEMDGQALKSLDDLEQILRSHAPGDWVPVRYHDRKQPGVERVTNVRLDGSWYPSERCKRDDTQGLWRCRELPFAKPQPSAPPSRISDGPMSPQLEHMFVNVRFDMPYWVAGFSATQHSGTGIIVDAKAGWILTDRTTVPTSTGNLTLTFAGRTEVEGRLIYMHPVHNFAIVGYDPEHVAHLPIRQADLSEDTLEVGEEVVAVGLDSRHALAKRSTTVASIRHTVFANTTPPRFASATVRTARLSNPPEHYEGVLLNKAEEVGAFWLSFAQQSGSKTSYRKLGIDARLVADTLQVIRRGEQWRSMEIDWQPITLAEARRRGLTDEQAQLLPHTTEQLFAAVRVGAGAPAAEQVRVGDIAMRVAGQTPTNTLDIERASQMETVTTTVLRDGELLDLSIPTVGLSGTGLTELLVWGGAVLHTPHRALSVQFNQPANGVYVASYRFGSPASRYGLEAAVRIVEVQGERIHDLNGLAKVLAATEHGAPVTLNVVNTIGAPRQITMIADHIYWPPYRVHLGENGAWQRNSID